MPSPSSTYTHTTARRTDGVLRWTFALALGAFALLSALDVATTGYALANGGMEANRLVRALIGHSGLLGFALVKLTTTGAEAGIFLTGYLVLPGRWRWLAVAALLVADAWLFVLAGHNLLLVLLTGGLL